MKADLIIYNIGQLVTCASNLQPKRLSEMQKLGIISDGALAIADGKITGVGTSADVCRNYQSENAIDANAKVVCPAFVEPHTHIVYAGNRLDEFELKIKGADYLEILENGGGILSTVRKTREAELRDLVEETAKRLDKLLKFGVATCEVKTGYGLDTETELKMLAAIFALDEIHRIDLIPTFLPAHAVPPAFKNNADAYVDLICSEMLMDARRLYLQNSSDFQKLKTDKAESFSRRIVERSENSNESAEVDSERLFEADYAMVLKNNPFFVDVFCEKNAFDLMQTKRILETAKRLGFGLKAHVDEFTNLGAARTAIELGAASIDHLDRTSDEEIRLLAKSETIGIVTPTVNFNFGATDFADARRMIDAGCAIAVSTDYNPGSAPCPSPAMAMAIACRYQKLAPAEALNAATINAAFAVGLGEKIGSLEIGKQADLLLLDTTDYRELAYEFGGSAVEKVVKKGEVLLQN